MKKVILTENQIKRMVDKLILNEQETNNSQTNQNGDSIDNNSKYELYRINRGEIALERNGGDIKMFSLEIHRGGYNPPRYLSGEMAINPTFTLTQFGNNLGFDVIHNMNIFDGTYTPSEKSKRKKQLTGYTDTILNGVTIRGVRNTGEEVPLPKEEIQDVVDPKTKENLNMGRLVTNGGLSNARLQTTQFSIIEPIQWEKIGNSLTPGIPCFVIGQSGNKSNVPILGTMFIMETRQRDLPKDQQLDFIDYKEGAQLTYGKTAIKNGRNYYWLKFIGSWLGNGNGIPFNPGEEDEPETPKDTPNEDPIVLTFEKGLNDAFNFNDITLNDAR
jgi:hypothetical protein